MIEPLSGKLRQRLEALQLCSRSDLRRCCRRVRRLARDLPAFDSVWIDALLQDRRLTPFQARVLESPHPEQLSVGPCVLIDELGRGRGCATYLARLGREQRCVLKMLQRVEETTDLFSRLQVLTAKTGDDDHPHVVIPNKVILHEDRLFLLSRFAPGTPLTELLIRRGRFPADVVRAIARQLIDGLSHLERRGMMHGEIALRNMRLSPQGTVTLTDAGIATIVRPEVIIDSELPPERFDGVAPERIATGNPATPASEIYALGCLLWQLLAGRPPFPTGDSLAKLANHQTRAVTDIREWVPGCPDDLADLLAAMTAFDAHDRPAGFADLEQHVGRPTSSGCRRTRRFHASFKAVVPRIRLRSSGAGFVKRSLTAAVVGLAATLGIALLDRDFRAPLLQIASPISKRIQSVFESDEETANSETRRGTVAGVSDQAKPLPKPDTDGLIRLESPGPYAWTKTIRSLKPIVIRGKPGKRPTVLMQSGSSAIAAPKVVFENVRFVSRANPRAVNAGPMLRSATDLLILRGCRFAADSPITAVEWSPATGNSAIKMDAVLQNTVFSGAGTVLSCRAAPTSIRIENVLQIGPGSLLKTPAPDAGRIMTAIVNRLTQRNGTAFVNLAMPVGRKTPGRVVIAARNCVFHIEKSGALCVFRAAFPGQVASGAVQFSGEGNLFPPGGTIGLEAGIGPGSSDSLAEDAVLIDGGLIAGPFEFAGPAGPNPSASVISKHRAPLRSSQPPGIDGRTLKSPRP